MRLFYAEKKVFGRYDSLARIGRKSGFKVVSIAPKGSEFACASFLDGEFIIWDTLYALRTLKEHEVSLKKPILEELLFTLESSPSHVVWMHSYDKARDQERSVSVSSRYANFKAKKIDSNFKDR